MAPHTSAQFSLVLRVRIAHRDVAASVAAAVADEPRRQGAATVDEAEIGYAAEDGR